MPTPSTPFVFGRTRRVGGRAFALAVLLFDLISPAIAQKTDRRADSLGSDQASDSNEITVLDPFVISAAEDHESYEATATMAATRIRTDLKDVGSAISVVTAQFLKDTGARSSQDLLLYTTNTEVGGPRGNFAGLFDSGASLDDLEARLSPLTNTRIRGLGAADNTRDFFLTDIPWDSFNTGRVDIQRGPNAVLFGLGSPAGIINASINTAAFKNEGSVELRTGSYGSHRATLDFNRVLLPQELALRFDALDDRTEYEQRPAFNHDRRVFGALRWDPKFLSHGSAHTSLRLNFEHGQIDANRPHVVPPTDQITPWFTVLNKVGVDPATWQSDPAVNNLLTGSGSGGISAIFADPASSASTLGTGGGSGSTLAGLKNPSDYSARSASPSEAFKVYRASVLQDPSIFDYVHQLIEGPNKREWSGHDIGNVALAQTFFHDRLGVEAAYDHQQTARGATSAGGGIGVDINTRLLDGSLNPNFGRAFTSGGDVFGNATFSSTREARRLTGFGELRFADFMQKSPLTRLLGRHVFTGFWNREQADTEYFDWISPVADLSFAPHTGDISIYNRLIGEINYLGPSLAGRTSASGAHLPNLQAVQHAASGTVRYFDVPTADWAILPVTVIGNFDGARVNGNHATLTRDDVESRGLVWQGFLLDGLVVPMIGLHHDHDRSYAMNNAPRNPDGTIDFASPDYRLPSTPDHTGSGDSTSWSVVVHAPQFVRDRLPGHADLSLFYNRSENFQPVAGRIDVLGDPLPAPAGRTKDYGFRLGLLDDRVALKVNWYQTDVTNDALPGFGGLFALPNAEAWGYMFSRATLFDNGNGYRGYAGGYQPLPGQTAAEAKADGIAITTAFLDPRNQPPDSFYTLYHIDRSGWQGFIQGGIPPGFTVTGDTESTGLEYEITAQPVAGWNISFNASKTDARSHNMARSIGAWIEQRWAVFNTPVAGTSRPSVIGDVRLFGPNPGFTVRDLYRDNLWVPYLIYKLKEGANVGELRPWHYNLVTGYTFPRGRFKDLRLGGAVRWQGREVVGYPVFPTASADSTAVFDLLHPYRGPAETNVDLWIGYERKFAKKYTWHLQLNVNNVFAKKDLIPINVQPDGSLAAGRIPPPRIWTVTNSISF